MPSRCLVDGRQLMDPNALYCSLRYGKSIRYAGCPSVLFTVSAGNAAALMQALTVRLDAYRYSVAFRAEDCIYRDLYVKLVNR